MEALGNATIYRAVGCKACRMTGYTGRQALFELMTITPPIRQVLLRGGSSVETAAPGIGSSKPTCASSFTSLDVT